MFPQTGSELWHQGHSVKARGVRGKDTKSQVVEIARFFKVSDGFQFVKDKDDYSSKKPIFELEIGIAVRMLCK